MSMIEKLKQIKQFSREILDHVGLDIPVSNDFILVDCTKEDCEDCKMDFIGDEISVMRTELRYNPNHPHDESTYNIVFVYDNTKKINRLSK